MVGRAAATAVPIVSQYSIPGRGYMIARKLQIEPHSTVSGRTEHATNDYGGPWARGGDLVDIGSSGRDRAGGSAWRKGCCRAREVLRCGIWPEGDRSRREAADGDHHALRRNGGRRQGRLIS